jgi:hypothetical protein
MITAGPFQMTRKATRSASSQIWWQVNTRSGDVIRHHKFSDQEKAEAFAAAYNDHTTTGDT